MQPTGLDESLRALDQSFGVLRADSVGHYWGYRNFDTPDASRNIVPFGVLIGGEEFHNNHHAYAYSAKFSNKWWEFDIAWFYIRLLERFGLATVKRTARRR